MYCSYDFADCDFFYSTLDTLPHGIVAVDQKKKVLFANKAAENHLGINKDLIAGKPLLNYFNKKDINRALKGTICTGKKITANNRIWLTSYYPVFKDNQVLGALIVLLPFVEAQNKILSVDREDPEYIQKLNLELEGIIESSYDGIGIVDDKGYLIQVNHGYERVTGLKKEDVIGRRLCELVEDGVISVAPSLEAIRRKETVTALQKIKTGTEVLITASPVFDKNGKVVWVIGNIRDMTELNSLKDENAKYRNLNLRYQSEIQELRTRTKFQEELIVQSPAMKKVVELAIRVAQASCNVLITGETGVGKGVIANLIHHTSSRCNNPFIKINCAAIPGTLLESELFGYESGAFSGAQKGGKVGLFEIANGGTILLDEIGDMPLELQPKLLRVIQDQTLYRVGGTREIKVDVRIIAATNEDLREKIAQNQFRKDLFYRLNVVPIEIPPLRKRREDILPLAITFLNKYNLKYGTQKHLAFDTQDALEGYSWPGNVRELESIIERLLIIGEEPQITAKDINQMLLEVNGEINSKLEPIIVNFLIPLPEAYTIVERELLLQALRRFKSARQAARALKITHPTVLKKATEYKLDFNRWTDEQDSPASGKKLQRKS